MPAAEPSLEQGLSSPATLFLATRPAFLTVTLGACLIGLATAYAGGVELGAATATATIVFALVAQAGANVLNDYYDALNGTDSANTERVFPFTGGSRFIQNGLLSERQTLVFGTALMAATVAAGLWLTAVSGTGLLFFGVFGIFVGWAYSAPPFRLAGRGLGEPAIWIAWMIVAAGSDYVQRHAMSPAPWIASAGYALLVANVLFINQFPDRRADALAGKRHWVVRLGPQRARHIYTAIGFAANGCVVLAVAADALPVGALLALLALPITLKASSVLWRYAEQPAKLEPAIKATIAAVLVHGVLLSVGIAASRWF